MCALNVVVTNENPKQVIIDVKRNLENVRSLYEIEFIHDIKFL